MTYRSKFIDSFRFMSTSLSRLVDNLSQKFHIDKFKNCKSEFNFMPFEYNQLIFQCFECKMNYVKNLIKN